MVPVRSVPKPKTENLEVPDVRLDFERGGRAAVGYGVVESRINDVARPHDRKRSSRSGGDGEARPRNRVARPRGQRDPVARGRRDRIVRTGKDQVRLHPGVDLDGVG